MPVTLTNKIRTVGTKTIPIRNEFVTTKNGNFVVNKQPFKYVGTNKYQTIINYMSQSDLDAYFAACVKNGMSVVRTWAFDTQGFRSLFYPVGTNLFTNGSVETDTSGITLGGDFSRSNDTAAPSGGSYSIKQVSSGGFSSFCNATPIVVTPNTDYVLTFWHKTQNTFSFPDIVFVGTTQGDNSIKDGGFIPDTGGLWVKEQVIFNSGAHSAIVFTIGNFSGGVNAYFDLISISTKTGTPDLEANELQLRQMDLVLNEARKYGIRLILSFMDSNEFNYNSKSQYVQWANTIYGDSFSNSFPYYDFFTSAHCQTIYKGFIDLLTARVNTINGISYKNDAAIFSWELGNELRANNFEGGTVNTINSTNLSAISNPGGWADIMSTYLKSKDPNHLVSFGDMGHTWQWVNGDTVSNGTYYGVDYSILIALPNIDYLDFHTYPTQGDNVHLQEYGQRLGYPNAVSGDGFRAQLKDYVAVAKANGKPAICGETGFIRETIGDTTYFPLYPRSDAFAEIFNTFFNAGGDGVALWQCETGDGGSYTVNLNGWNGDTTNLNFDDIPVQNNITTENTPSIRALRGGV